MPFEVGESINYISDRFVNSPIIGGALKNPIYNALLITVIIFFLIIFVFRNAKSPDGIIVLAARASVYTFIVVIIFTYLSTKLLKQEYEIKGGNQTLDEMFSTDLSSNSDMIGITDAMVNIPVDALHMDVID